MHNLRVGLSSPFPSPCPPPPLPSTTNSSLPTPLHTFDGHLRASLLAAGQDYQSESVWISACHSAGIFIRFGNPFSASIRNPCTPGEWALLSKNLFALYGSLCTPKKRMVVDCGRLISLRVHSPTLPTLLFPPSRLDPGASGIEARPPCHHLDSI